MASTLLPRVFLFFFHSLDDHSMIVPKIRFFCHKTSNFSTYTHAHIHRDASIFYFYFFLIIPEKKENLEKKRNFWAKQEISMNIKKVLKSCSNILENKKKNGVGKSVKN